MLFTSSDGLGASNYYFLFLVLVVSESCSLFQVTSCRHEYHLQCILEW